MVVSTLESKLQRIENLDKAVEHLMRRVELLDSRVTDNIDKTDSVIARLRSLDLKLFAENPQSEHQQQPQQDTLDSRLVSLDQKVSDIDSKLAGLKTQLDSNLLPADDINAEASEKKPISMSLGDVTKVLTAEVVTRVSRELDGLRTATSNVDRKLQFHINLVSENLGKVLTLVSDVHGVVVAGQQGTTLYSNSSSTGLDKLVRPLLSVSEKMDEVWDVVVGTKSSVDGLVPKSDELLTQTQRQERAINDVHADLRSKTNKIIANLDQVCLSYNFGIEWEGKFFKTVIVFQVEQRLRQGDLMRPVPAELLLDPTIDRLVEYDHATGTEPLPPPPSSTVALPAPAVALTTFPTTTPGSTTLSPVTTTTTTAASRAAARNRGVIFPSVKNKPMPANNTFTTDVLASLKDIKVIPFSNTS